MFLLYVFFVIIIIFLLYFYLNKIIIKILNKINKGEENDK